MPEVPPPAAPRRRVIVIGAGIAGLAAAWYLAELEPSAQITVLDGASEVGGKLRRGEVAGVSVDTGAEALLARRPEGIDLIDAVGLHAKLIAPLTLSAQVRAGGSNHPLPARTMLGIPGDLSTLRASGVLSDSALRAVEAEPTQPPLPPLGDDVSVGELVRRRLGAEVVERLVDPLLGGVYAGRADALSLDATMPALAARLRRNGGSLVQAADAATTPAPVGRQSAGSVFVSLAGGLGQLPAAIAATGRFTVRTGATVRAIRRAGDGFALD
jgi:oxygen-dependent protoporphyrinogen oxidase